MENKDYKQVLINRAFQFSLNMMRFIDTFPLKDLSIQIVARQVVRSATSIGANIVEAQSSSSKKDFINFLHHALKSANESRYWLGLLKESKKVDFKHASILLKEAQELSNMLGSSILTLKGKK